MKQSPAVASTHSIDRLFHAQLGKATFGLSPISLMVTYLDWFAHLMISPGKQAELLNKVRRKTSKFAIYAAQSVFDSETPPIIEPLPQDRRFRNEAWQRWPFNLIHQSFLLNQQIFYHAVTDVRGVSQRHEQTMCFLTRQLLNVFSPSNFVFTNPEVLETTVKEGGKNLLQGWMNFVEDQERVLNGRKPVGTEEFQVGRNLAITPGKVVFRNHLMELIQYAPATEKVYKEPVLMLSAWMMKYYIMDLSPENSMVKYLVDHGHTVFMISWVNPGKDDRNLDMEDYRELGIMDALKVINGIVPDTRIHAVGYCLGGIILTIAAAAMCRDRDRRLASLTLLTTLTDFSDPGEFAVFIDPGEVSYLEDLMWEQGYLDPRQAAGSFQLLRSHDLIWSKMVREYLLGRRQPMFDLMAWNIDGTRMPYRQYSQLLRRLFLNNDLWEGRYRVGDRPIAISDIHVPIFVVAATADHVAPWRSVYKLHLQADAEEITFVLANGDHNVGIVNPPSPKARGYHIATSKANDRYVDPDTWRGTVPSQEGSWWPAWEAWLRRRSSDRMPPSTMGNSDNRYGVLADAPGTYVLQE